MKSSIKRKFFAVLLSLFFILPVTAFAAPEKEDVLQQGSLVSSSLTAIEAGELTLIEESTIDETASQFVIENDTPFVKDSGDIATNSAFSLSQVAQLDDWTPATTTRASLPDLTFGTLTIDKSLPYPSNTNVKYEIEVKNIGSASATNMTVSLYLDDKPKGTFTIQGTLGAGQKGSFYFNLVVLGGTHTVKIILNEGHEIIESNYNNNTNISTGRWQDCIALAVGLKFDGENRFESCETHDLLMVVTNTGNLPVQEMQLILDYGEGKKYMSATIGSLKQSIWSLPISFNRKGKYTLNLTVNPVNPSTDITPNDNTASCQAIVSYDTEIFAGKWPNAKAKQLNIQFHSLALQFFNEDDTISASQAASAIRKWNGLNSNVSLGTIKQYPIDNDSIMSDVQIIVVARNGPPDELGYTYLYKDAAGTEEITDDMVYTDKSPYGRAVIALDYNTLSTLVDEYQQRTLTHEIGHALGLAHPEACKDVAIMRTTDDSYSSLNIEGHDIYNLNKKY